MNREQSIIKLHKFVADQRLDEARNFSVDLAYAFPQDVTIWLMRGDLHFALEEWESVIECCQHIISLPPVVSVDSLLIKLYRALGLAYYKTGRINDAIYIYRCLTQKVPEDAHVRTNLAMCYLLLGEFQRGLPEYEWRLKGTQKVSGTV